ncbi:hypothetical protein N0V83_000446 [Neocucurbitaria cava]|uniref:Xylanolytic transcriptional activator regulatory domain-containing protein n=1 Tax=Neocucurbitaria cava TaxID=798079 RepID=A0A9W9CS53_9PLEO|nr:hypothetical protein N0V83_000446 [Neocucurbitaria cava]
MKRKNEEMQGELSNLRQLYDFLRLRPEQEAMEIMRRIRANPPNTSPSQRIQELADFMGELVSAEDIRQIQTCQLACESTLPPPTSLEAILHPSPSSAMGDSSTDPRLLSAKNWTTVTGDINILVDLFSAWTTREHSYFHYLDREAFLDDMASGRTEYCSELLVNALLASACFHSDAVKDRQKPFSETSMTTMFYKEARRLWDLEEGKDSLTKLQAGLCLFMVLGKYGRDKVGHTFLLEACRIGRDLGLFQSQPLEASWSRSSETQRKWENVRAVTAWALFNFQM